MNYHTDEWINDRVRGHYDEALKYFPKDRIIGIFLQGSQNYLLDMPTSDIDTKLIVTPSLNDLIFNKQPISTTHVRANNEHIDFKDVRLYLQTFRKQNLNFLEILFTPYFILNTTYKDEWMRLVDANEDIANFDPKRAINSMRGLAHNKYKQLYNNTPAHESDIKRFGYSPKEFCHLKRIEEYIERYINGEKYADCLISKQPEFLKNVKLGTYTLGDVQWMAKVSIDRIDETCDKFIETCAAEPNQEVNDLLDDVQYNIMMTAIKTEVLRGKK